MEVEMIKQSEKAKVRTIRANSTDTDIALIQQELDTIKNNHLHHMKEDIDRVEKKVDKIDNRIWWVLGLLVASVVGPMLASLFG
jgi:polyhydroxyalkanoate synthesis regulator phasin